MPVQYPGQGGILGVSFSFFPKEAHWAAFFLHIQLGGVVFSVNALERFMTALQPLMDVLQLVIDGQQILGVMLCIGMYTQHTSRDAHKSMGTKVTTRQIHALQNPHCVSMKQPKFLCFNGCLKCRKGYNFV